LWYIIVDLKRKVKLLFTKTQKLKGIIKIKTHLYIKQASDTATNYQNTEANSPLFEEKAKKEKRYHRMKEINRKYSKIVLVKRDTMKEKLEMKKASHSLDLGVRRGHSIYKPEFKLKELSNNTNTQKYEYSILYCSQLNLLAIWCLNI